MEQHKSEMLEKELAAHQQSLAEQRHTAEANAEQALRERNTAAAMKAELDAAVKQITELRLTRDADVAAVH